MVVPVFRSANLVAAVVLVASAAWAQLAVPSSRFVPGRALVQFRQGVTSLQAQQVLQSVGTRFAREAPDIGIHVLELPPTANEMAVIHSLQARPEVAFAEPDYILPLQQQVTPNDPYYPSEWHLGKIQASGAWSVTTGSPAIIIAIADTGVDATHPDLVSKIVPGWNVVSNNSNTSDAYGHGTKVAGTAAAATNNGVGVASPAWGCLIMPVRVSEAGDGSSTVLDIANAIVWAAGHGARVVNVSYAVTGSGTVDSAAQKLQSKGGVVVVSAGNDGYTYTSGDDPYLITVSATDPNDVIYSWSSRGNIVDLAAPGCTGMTTTSGGGYASACGTSFSAPLTAGVAALMLSANPGLTAADVARILKQSADDLGAPGWDTTYAWGRLNAAQAVSLAMSGGSAPDTQPPSVSFSWPASGAILSGVVSVQVSAVDDAGVSSVSLAVAGATLGTASTAPYTFTWDTTKYANGAYTLTATARDLAANQSQASISVTVSNTKDTVAPAVWITSPAAGATVAGNIAVSVTATDNVGVVKAELCVDGSTVGTSATAPFSIRWNAKKQGKGTHTLQVKAYDTAGNVGVSQSVTVVVN